MTSLDCSGDDDDDGDDDVSFTGDDVISSAALDHVALPGCEVLDPPEVVVVHLETTCCSPLGDGVDVVW